MNNFFTTCELYNKLYKQEVGANGTAKAGSGIPKELAYLREAMIKQNDHEDWYNYVVGNVNCIGFYDMAASSMMTTVHDPITEEYTFFDRVKRPEASLKNAKPVTPSQEAVTSAKKEEMWLLRKLYALHDYNQNMGGSDSHAQQSSYYSTAQHYHQRNWLPLFYMLIDAAVTNSYILYKHSDASKTGKKLTHVEFQQEIAKALLRGPGAILRKRLPRHPLKAAVPHTKSVPKAAFDGHS
jgi:Transposase IS4